MKHDLNTLAYNMTFTLRAGFLTTWSSLKELSLLNEHVLNNQITLISTV